MGWFTGSGLRTTAVLERPLTRRRVLAGGVLLGVGAALAACGGDDDLDDATPTSTATGIATSAAASPTATATARAAEPTPTPTPTTAPAASAEGAFPRTITDMIGEVTIPSRPARVATLTDFGDLEVVLALGVQPVLYGFTDAWGTGGGAPWVPEALFTGLEQHDFTTYEIDFEALAMGAPDLIIGMDWAGQDVLEQLNAIAPTVLIAESMPWREVLSTVGAALGLEAEAEAQIATIEELFAATAAELTDYADMPIMVGSAFGDVLYLQGAQTPIGTIFAELGLNFVPGDAPVLTEASLEQVNLLEPAEILLSFATDPEGTAALEASPLFLTLPAVQRGGYYPIPPVEARGLASGINPFSAEWGLPILSEIVRMCGDGAGKEITGA